MSKSSRRKFIRSAGIIGGSALATGIYAWKVEPRWLEYVQLDLFIKGLPPFWEGKIIVQISDLHVGDSSTLPFLKKSLEDARKWNPDLVFFTGDFINYNAVTKLYILEDVLKTSVRGTLGTYAVLGNHDYGLNWQDSKVAEKVIEVLKHQNYTVLRNEIEVKEGVQIGGIDDIWGTNVNPKEVTSKLQSDFPSLILCHNPDAIDMDIWDNFNGIVFSGHTHGGQIKPPFLPPPFLPVHNKEYDQGLKKIKPNQQLYINRAVGALWPLRFNVRPEITIFTLYPK